MDDADRPWPDDPPFDALSMVEVAEEARQRAIAQREAAVRVMIPAAITAILRGAHPLDVMEACGWQPEGDREPQLQEMGIFGMTMVRMMAQPSRAESFARWLSEWLSHEVMDRAQEPRS